MKKKIISILIVLLVTGGYIGYKIQNKPLNVLNYAKWNQLPEDTQGFFASLNDGNMEEGKEFYNMYFMKYNPIHEVSHGIRSNYHVKSSLFGEEQAVNDMAVAYFREIGEGEFIERLQIKLNSVLSHMKNPTPKGADPAEFFNKHYHELGPNPEAYGYYQFSFVLNSINKNENLYESLVKNVSTEAKAKNKDAIILEKGNKEDDFLYEALVKKVSKEAKNKNIIISQKENNDGDIVISVKHFVERLKLYNIKSPDFKFNNEYKDTIQSID